MPLVLESLLPILLLTLLGHALLRTGLVPAEGWVGLERVLYYAAFPALIVASLARAELTGETAAALIATLIAAQGSVAVLVVALRPWVLGRIGASRPAYTSLVQGSVRWNAMVALALVGALWGREAVSLAAFGLAAMIPLANLISVSALAIDGEGRETPGAGGLASLLVGQLVRNPLILAVALGLALSLTGLTPPKFVFTTLDWLGQASIATGVLLVGAGIEIAAIRPGPVVMLSAALKLIVTPLLMLAAGLAFGLPPLAIGVAILCGATPTASAAYVLARRMGGDAPLMARIVATQTVLAAASLPLAIWIAGLL